MSSSRSVLTVTITITQTRVQPNSILCLVIYSLLYIYFVSYDRRQREKDLDF